MRIEQGQLQVRSASSCRARAAAAAIDRSDPKASNVLLVDGSRSATGTPIFVGGPQIGYNYPGLTTGDRPLRPDDPRPRRDRRAVPRLHAHRPRRALRLDAHLGGADIIDTYAERLCGGSRTRYRYKGRCRRMERVNAGTIAQGDEKVRVRFRRTVHGPVIGYARVAGGKRVVALSQRRSSAGRETTDQIFFQKLTYGQRPQRARLRPGGGRDAADVQLVLRRRRRTSRSSTTGRLPLRPKGVNGDLPTDGRGRFEWRASSRPPGTRRSSTRRTA